MKEGKKGKKKEKKEGNSHTPQKNPNVLWDIYGEMESGNYTLIK